MRNSRHRLSAIAGLCGESAWANDAIAALLHPISGCTDKHLDQLDLLSSFAAHSSAVSSIRKIWWHDEINENLSPTISSVFLDSGCYRWLQRGRRTGRGEGINDDGFISITPLVQALPLSPPHFLPCSPLSVDSLNLPPLSPAHDTSPWSMHRQTATYPAPFLQPTQMQWPIHAYTLPPCPLTPSQHKNLRSAVMIALCARSVY